MREIIPTDMKSISVNDATSFVRQKIGLIGFVKNERVYFLARILPVSESKNRWGFITIEDFLNDSRDYYYYYGYPTSKLCIKAATSTGNKVCYFNNFQDLVENFDGLNNI